MEKIFIFLTWDMAMKNHKSYKNLVSMLIHGGLTFSA
jgi:hypothetical protein